MNSCSLLRIWTDKNKVGWADISNPLHLVRVPFVLLVSPMFILIQRVFDSRFKIALPDTLNRRFYQKEPSGEPFNLGGIVIL